MFASATPHPDSAPIGMIWRHFAYLRLRARPVPGADGPGRRQEWRNTWRDDWRDACYRLTPRVERMSMEEVLLDLGECADAEALAALQSFLRQAADAGWRVRAGVGASCIMAQVAAAIASSDASPHGPLMLIPPQLASALLRTTPVALLPRLHPRGSVTVRTVERLHAFGLHTLGHIARLDEAALRRQFGNAVGAFLAAVAAGRDVRPFRPDPPPARLGVKVRLAMPLAPDRLLALLPMLGTRLGGELRRRGRRARTMRVRVGWESGGQQRAMLVLRQHTSDPQVLAGELRRLLLRLMRPNAEGAVAVVDAGNTEAIAALRVTLEDFAPAAPMQTAFWQTHDARLTALEEVADTLRQRHGRPLLHRLRLVAPAAIFPEDRYRLLPVAHGHAIVSDEGERGEKSGSAGSSAIPPRQRRRRAMGQGPGASAACAACRPGAPGTPSPAWR